MITRESTLSVSVIIPCRNEFTTIGLVLEDLQAQSIAQQFEVIIVDGESDDGTKQLLRRLQTEVKYRFDLLIIDNPLRVIPSALNKAILVARGEMIIRIDGHSRLPVDYLKQMVAALRVPACDVVGPSVEMIAGGKSSVAAAIALLLSSPFGTGGTASRRRLREPISVKHAVMSCYRRLVWERVGGYDERLISNEDFDFDYRAVKNGMSIFALPTPVFQLVARSTLVELAKQRWRYGWWKAAVLRKHPGSLHFRQILPMMALLAFIVICITVVILPARWPVAAILIISYVIACIVAGGFSFRVRNLQSSDTTHRLSMRYFWTTILLAPVIFSIIHGVWAAGALIGLIGNRLQGQWPAVLR
jgi:succinoglycan biosynthesis protein ExoA